MKNNSICLSILLGLLFLHELSTAQVPDFLWAHGIGDVGHDEAKRIVADNSGNIFVTGFFEGTVDFDPGSSVSTMTSASSQDIYLMKMDENGNLLWVKQFGSTGTAYAMDIEVDSSGYVYLLGSFTGTLDGDPGTGVVSLTTVLTMAFIIKLDDSGLLAWARQFEGTAEVFPTSIDVSYPGNVYIHGDINDGTVDFDTGPGTFNLSTPTMWGFLCKLDSSGNLVWAKFPSQIPNWFGEIAVDAYDNVLITGRFAGIVDFNPGPAVNTLSASSFDVYLQKLDGSGNFIFASSFGGPGNDTGYLIDIDGNGNILLEGIFEDSADFDPGQGVFQMLSIGGSDIFYVKLNSIGEFQWAGTLGTATHDAPVYSSFDKLGNMYIVNLIWNTMDLNPDVNAVNMLNTMGSNDGFVVKLDSAGNYQWVKIMGNNGWDVLNQICFDVADNIYLAGYFNSPTIDFSSILVSNHITVPPSYDLFVAKLESTTSGLPSFHSVLAGVSPNPASETATFTFPVQEESGRLEMMDALGRIVFSEAVPPRSQYKNLDVRSLSPGLYVCRFQWSERGATVRILVE